MPHAGLWQCPRCGARLVTANGWHSCGTFDLAPLFARSEPNVREIYDAFLAALNEIGPVTVIPQKSRIAIQARMRFAALVPQKSALRGHLVLSRRTPSPCFSKIESLGPRSHVHVFRLGAAREIDAAFRRLLRAAYAVGEQAHLRT